MGMRKTAGSVGAQRRVSIETAIEAQAGAYIRRTGVHRVEAGMGSVKNESQPQRAHSQHPTLGSLAVAVVAVAALAAVAPQAHAGPREQAKRMYDRLTGTPPSPTLLDELESRVGGGSQNQLFDTAMYIVDPQQPHSSPFYSVVLKNFATPWTNRDQDVFAPLNDYTATVIGLVRDNADFRRVLWDDILYVGRSGTYSPANNDMYEALESNHANLRDELVPAVQSSLNGLPPDATAGVITSRAAAQAFFIDGTNRAMFRFTMLNHLCRDLEQVMDFTKPPDRIRQDVTRSPGGDSSVFLNNCLGCHSVMDSMAQAFAYYDFDETLGAGG